MDGCEASPEKPATREEFLPAPAAPRAESPWRLFRFHRERMAPREERASGLLLLLLALLAGPALGNEGGSAGACGCPTIASEKPGKLKKYPWRMKTWEPCMVYVKFTFNPKEIYCGWESSNWVIELTNGYPGKKKGAVRPSASRAPPKPALSPAPKPSTSTSQASLTAQPPTLSLRVIPEETPATQPAPEAPTDAAQPPTPARSPALPSGGSLEAGTPGQAPRMGEIGGSLMALLSLLAVPLCAVAAIVACQRRQRGRVILVPRGDPEEHIHLPHREGT